jgi:pectin methylesterase-like acyl-CoA thioesterase
MRIVVDQAGNGDYTTIQEAVDAVPPGNTKPATIVVGPGLYHEVVTVPADKPFITLAGATGDYADVTISYENSAATITQGDGTAGSATVTVAASDLTATGITFQNDWDYAAKHSQAVALRTVADRVAFYRCRFVSHQDTLYLDATSKTDTDRVYLSGCSIAGSVDFIFGPATAVLDRCTIEGLDSGGYITAASTQLAHPYGFLFTRCTFVSDAPAKTFYLGRPWHHSGDLFAVAQVVVRNCYLGAQVKDQSWTDMSGWSWVAARFYEYGNTGPGSGVSLFRPQLEEAEALRYTRESYLSGTDHWRPWALSQVS